jgi:Ni/Fe-hydrogenase subunit HybB-like protein
MRNAVMWGQYILFFMFFVGLLAGGLIVASAGRLFGVKALKPITRLAVLEATVAVMLAATFILPDLGRPERIPADAGAGGALTGRGRAAGREPRGEAEFCPAP